MLNCLYYCSYWYTMSMLVHFHNIGRIFIFFLSVYTGALTPIWQLMTLDIDTQACQDTVSKSNLYVNAFHYVILILLKSQMKYIIQTKKKACWQRFACWELQDEIFHRVVFWSWWFLSVSFFFLGWNINHNRYKSVPGKWDIIS